MRSLTQADVERMMVPPRYYGVSLDGVQGEAVAERSRTRLRDVLVKFAKDAPALIDDGVGMLLYGNNGRGKTCALVWLAMQVRRSEKTVLYVETAKLRQYKIESTPFDQHQTMWERALSVDLLVLDDLGKGVTDSKGFMQEIVDELLRTRGAHLRSTFISTNIDPAALVRDDFLKKSTLAMLQETCAVFLVDGSDLRAEERVRLVERILHGGAHGA